MQPGVGLYRGSPRRRSACSARRADQGGLTMCSRSNRRSHARSPVDQRLCRRPNRASREAAQVFPIFKSWTLPLAVGAAYYIAAEVGGALAFPSAPVSVFWAPNAILMAALLLAPREQWWMYLAAIVPFHLFAQLLDSPLAQVIIQYCANVGLASLGALAILTISPTPHRFDRVRSALTLVLFGGLLAPASPAFSWREPSSCSASRARCGSPSWPAPSPTPSRW